MLVSTPHKLIVNRKVSDAVLEPGHPPGLRDIGVAKDLAQDGLVAAQEQWPKSKVLRDPGAWLMAIGKRRAIDLLRRRDRLELRGGPRLLGLGGTVALAALLGSGAACVAQSRSPSGLAGPEAAHSATTDTPAQGTSPSAGRLWGLWEPRWQVSDSPDFTQYTRVEALLGRRADIVHWYADWTEGWDYDGRLVDHVLQGGRAPMITWEAWDRPLRAIAAGQYDAYVDSWASGMAARQPEPIYMRIFHEFNDPVKHSSGSGYPWGVGGGTANRPADLVAAWRHVHDRFKLAGASNVRFIWSPDGVNLDPGLLRAAYPGDAYVDFAGWDTYGYDMAVGYRTLREVTQRPFMLPEVGSTDPAWVRNLIAKIASGQYGAIRAVVWFDQDSSRLDANPGVAAALRKALASFR